MKKKRKRVRKSTRRWRRRKKSSNSSSFRCRKEEQDEDGQEQSTTSKKEEGRGRVKKKHHNSSTKSRHVHTHAHTHARTHTTHTSSLVSEAEEAAALFCSRPPSCPLETSFGASGTFLAGRAWLRASARARTTTRWAGQGIMTRGKVRGDDESAGRPDKRESARAGLRRG